MKKALVFLAMATAITLLVPKGLMAVEPHDTIYKPGNIYIFEAKVDSVSKNTQRSCYIVMRVLDKEMYHQGVITYDYYAV
jgi:hypothetical protein